MRKEKRERRKVREVLVAFWNGQLELAKKEDNNKHPVLARFKLVEFVSRKEFGKRRKRPKEVTLLIISGEGAQDLNGKKPKKERRLDNHAEWALLEAGEDPTTVNAIERIVEILRQRQK